MAQRYRDLSDPDTQASLSSKFTSPIAQRVVAREASRAGNVADEANQQAESARRQQQQEMDQRSRELADSQKQQADAQEEARQRGLREAQAAGAVIETDVPTGQRKVATYADGAPKFNPGPLSEPKPIGETKQSFQIPGEAAPRSVPNVGVMMGGDPLGSANATGTETRAVWGQPVRDDRGNVSTIPPETKTDEKTGQQYFERKDPTTDRTVRQTIGQDPDTVAKLARSQRLGFESQALDLERNAFEQTKGAFAPQWSPAKEEFDKAETELKGVQDPAVRFQRRGKAWVRIDPDTGKESIATGEEVERHNRRYGAAKARHDAARTSYEPLKAESDRLEEQKRSLDSRNLKLGREKMLIDMGLPEEDGGVASILAKNAGLTQSVPGEDVVNRVTGGAELQERPQPDGSPATAAPAPLIPAESDAEAVKSAFGALRGVEGLEVEPFKHYTAINKGGKWIANIEDGGGSPIVVLRDDARQFGDINEMVAMGDTKGVPLYLRENPARKSVTAEATDVATVYQALQDPAFRDETGAVLPTLAERIEQLGATPEAIKSRVDNGELSIQHGESLMKNIYGGTLAVTDPNDPKAKAKWVEETSRMQKQLGQSGPTVAERMASATKGTDFSLADQNNLQADFGRDWYLANRGKPGVTRAKAQQVMGFDQSDGATLGEKVASAATAGRKLVVNDVIGSMFGLAAGAVKDLGAAEMALFGNEGAKKELDSSVTLRNRDMANFAQGAKRNAKIWATGEGAATKAEFDAAADGLRSTIDEVEDSGKPDPARIAAAEARVRQAALAMHGLAPDKEWPITEDNLNPDKESTLGGALARYKATADPREFELYKERMLMSNGRRQFSAEMEKKMRGKGAFQQAVTGGMHAGWQELGIELAADAAVLATGGASKAAQVGLRGAGAIGKAQRLAKVSEAIAQGLERAGKLGLRTDSLASPLSKVGKIQNAARTAVVGGVGEGVEEVISEVGADNPNLPGAFAMGGLGGMALAPVFIPMANAAESGAIKRNEARMTAENREFATKFNATMAGTPGFTPITPDTAGAARGFVNGEEFTQAATAVQQAREQLAQASSTPEPNEKDVAKLSSLQGRIAAAEKSLENAPPDRATAIEGQLAAMREQEATLASTVDPGANGTASKMQAAKVYDEALGNLAIQTESAVAAASEIQAVADPAKKAFLSGVAKVATGNGQLLTQAERGAVGGAVTRAGAPFFANVGGRDVLTDEGRAEMLAEFPAVGSLIQTTESQAIANGVTNPPIPTPNGNPVSQTEGVPPVGVPVPPVQGQQSDPTATGVTPDVATSGANQPAVQGAVSGTDAPGVRSGGSDLTGGGGPASGTGGQAAEQGVRGDTDASREVPTPPVGDATAEAEPEAETAEIEGQSPVSRQLAAIEKRYPKLKGRFKLVNDPVFDSAFFALPSGIYVNSAEVDEDLASYPEEERANRIAAAVDEEIIHVAGFEHARIESEKLKKRLNAEEQELFVRGWWNGLTEARRKSLGNFDVENDFFAAFNDAYYSKLWNEFDKNQQAEFANIYGPAFNGLTDSAKGAEAVRMVIQEARSGNPTERLNLKAVGQSAMMRRILETALEFLKDFVKGAKTSPVVQEAIDAIQAILDGYESGGAETGIPATQPATQEATPTLPERVEIAAEQTNTEPTEGQKEAGNYRKGKVPFKGLTMSIENPRGSERSGTDSKGNKWTVELAHHYGYFLGTEGKDGDHIDVFMGPNPESDQVFIVNQINPETGRFDEHKVMAGFDSRKEAIAGYLANYAPGWRGLGDMVETTVDGLKNWINTADTTKRAAASDFGGQTPAPTPKPSPAKPKAKPVAPADKVALFKAEPVISGIIRAGGMQSWTDARKGQTSEWIDDNSPSWDDAPILPPAFNAVLYSPGTLNTPDRIAQQLANEGIGDGSVNWLWNAIERAADGARDTEGRRDSSQDPNREWTSEEIDDYLRKNGLSAAKTIDQFQRLLAASVSPDRFKFDEINLPETTEEWVNLREQRREAEISLIQREIGITREQAETIHEIAIVSGRDSFRWESRNLTPEQLERSEEFWENSEFNKVGGPIDFWNYSSDYNPAWVAEETDKISLAEDLVLAFTNGLKQEPSDKFVWAVAAARKFKELGGTKKDISDALIKQTRRVASGQGDSEFWYTEQGKKLNAFLELYADADTKQSERLGENPPVNRLMAANPNAPSLPQQVVDQISRGFTPVQRAVLMATIRPGGPTASGIANEINAAFDSGELKNETGRPMTEDAVTNIMDQVFVRLRALTEAGKAPGGLSPEMEGGKLKEGRSERAMTGSSPEVARIQQIRSQEGVPDVVTNESVYAEADRKMKEDYEGNLDRIVKLRSNGEVIGLVDLAMAQRYLLDAPVGLRTPEQQMKMAWLAADWIDQGTDDARRLQIRRDVVHTPAERAALYFTKELNIPSDAQTLRDLRKAGTKEAREAILKRWMKRRDQLKQSMINQGIDLDASLAAFQQQRELEDAIRGERPRTSKLIGLEVERLGGNEKAVIQTIMQGGTLESAALSGNMSVKQADKLYDTFRESVSSAMDEAAQKFIQQALSSAKALSKDEILSRLGLPSLSEVRDRSLPPEKRKKKKGQPAPERTPVTPEQQAKWDKMAEEFFARPISEWSTLWQEEMKNLAPMIGQKSFEEFKGEVLAPWKDLWQTEMPGVAWSEPKFQEWAGEQPARKQAVMGLFQAKLNEMAGTWKAGDGDFLRAQGELLGGQDYRGKDKGRMKAPAGPINETTGLLDFTDPISVKHAMDNMSTAKSTKWDKVLEFWRASILSGFQTGIVNVGSNAAYGAFSAVPRRAIEAGVNNVLSLVGGGTKDGATFREFIPMARELNRALRIGAQQALRSWQTESQLFDDYVSAEPVQLGFNGLGIEKFAPAIPGPLGKFMRSISFRHMGAADELFKTSYFRIDMAAQAHRIAYEKEGLRGKAYQQRLAELMQPGSEAAALAAQEARKVTFQQEIDPKGKQAITAMDVLADFAKKARHLPFIGQPLTFFLPFINTPLNVFKEAAQITPMGAFLALIDASRALQKRIALNKVSPELAKQEAAELYNRARLIKDVSNQLIGVATYMALQELVVPDEDDENALPNITGSMPYDATKKGERQNAQAVMPPMTIRIGDTQFSYNRIEPFATVLASMADLITTANKEGGLKPSVASEWFGRFKDQVGEKTFLVGISNLINAAKDPKRFAERLTAGILTGFVPNLIRQPIREANDKVRDTEGQPDDGVFESLARQIGYSIIPQMAPVRTDVWGNEIPTNRGEQILGTKATDLAARILDPTNLTLNPKIDPIDAWIFRFNQETADPKDRIGITPISNSISVTIDGERKNLTLTPEEQREANVNAGQMARAALGDDWKDVPRTEENKERIVETVRQAQKVERDRIRMTKIAEGIVIDGGEE